MTELPQDFWVYYARQEHWRGRLEGFIAGVLAMVAGCHWLFWML
jgi:hypothetical protein